MGKATPMTKKRTKRITLKELYAAPFKPVPGAGGEAAAILEHQLGKPIARSERGQFAARDINNLIARSREVDHAAATLPSPLFVWSKYGVDAFGRYDNRWFYGPEKDADYHVGGPFATEAEALRAAAACGQYQLYLYELKRAGGGL